jgi:O-antigen/teichoic acid export membrane protein
MHLGPYTSETAALGAVGLYALAMRLMSIAPYLGVRPMQQVWTAEMYEIYKTPEASHVFGNFTLRLLCIQALAVLLISLFSVEIVRVMCDSSYHGAAALIPLFGLYSMIALFVTQMNNTFFITRKTNYNLFCTLFTLPFILFLMWLLVPLEGFFGGIMGAVIAYVLSHSIYAGFVYYFSQRFFYVRYPFGKMAMLLLITVLCYFLSLFCGCGIDPSRPSAGGELFLSRWEKMLDAWYRVQWLSIIAKMGVVVLWGVLIWFSGILSQNDKALAIRLIKKGYARLSFRVK